MSDKKEHRDLLAEAEKLLSDSTNTAARDHISLRNAVCAYLAAERARGITAEAVHATLATILMRAEERSGNASDGHGDLAQQLIDWCLSLDQSSGPRNKLQNPD